MFDFGFSELVVIGAVALVVLGPEKLPVVARTAGEWIGKAQRMVAQVKGDIEREAELAELKKIQEEAKSAADNLSKTIKGETDSLQSEVKQLENDVKGVENDINASAKDVADSYKELTENTTGAVESDPEPKYKEVPAVDNTASATDDFYSWYGEDPSANDTSHVFEKRYKAGPSIDELAEQIEKLKAELGDRSPQLGGNNRRFASRARSNRVRIYR